MRYFICIVFMCQFASAITMMPARSVPVRTNAWSNMVVSASNVQSTFDWIDANYAQFLGSNSLASWLATNTFVTDTSFTAYTNTLSVTERAWVTSNMLSYVAWQSWLNTNNVARGFITDTGVVSVSEFSYTGSNVAWVVPTNATRLDIYGWGGGGSSGYGNAGQGGNGGFSSGTLWVTNTVGSGFCATGSTLIVAVGGPGTSVTNLTPTFGGGVHGGAGGSFVYAGTTSTLVLAAGGGGGGGGNAQSTPALSVYGGPGGGAAGGPGVATNSTVQTSCGNGGTYIAGGVGGLTTGTNIVYYGSNGLSRLGGAGATNGPFLTPGMGSGGGGGGGYFGGGGGGYVTNSAPYGGGGGGGGSGYVGGVLGGITTTAGLLDVAGSSNLYYVVGAGRGVVGVVGNPGRVVIVVK